MSNEEISSGNEIPTHNFVDDPGFQPRNYDFDMKSFSDQPKNNNVGNPSTRVIFIAGKTGKKPAKPRTAEHQKHLEERRLRRKPRHPRHERVQVSNKQPLVTATLPVTDSLDPAEQEPMIEVVPELPEAINLPSSDV